MILRTELEYRGYEESPYSLASEGRIINGISKSLTFLDADMTVIKVSVPKDCKLDFNNLRKGEVYELELDAKMQPVISTYNRNSTVSKKQFTVYFSIVNIPWLTSKSVNNTSPAPVQNMQDKKNGGKPDDKF